MCSPIAYFTQHMASFWRVTQRTLLQNQVQLFVAKTLKFILAIEIVLYEALTFKLQPTDSWVEHFFIIYTVKMLLPQAVVMLWSSHRTSDQGDVGSNPARGNNSFSQKLSSVEFPITLYISDWIYKKLPPNAGTIIITAEQRACSSWQLWLELRSNSTLASTMPIVDFTHV